VWNKLVVSTDSIEVSNPRSANVSEIAKESLVWSLIVPPDWESLWSREGFTELALLVALEFVELEPPCDFGVVGLA